LNEVEGSVARFVIECSSGTYIRSLAHEMGRSSGVARTSRKSNGQQSRIFAGASRQIGRTRRRDTSRKICRLFDSAGEFAAQFPKVNVLPIIERRVRHGTKFNITLAQVRLVARNLCPARPRNWMAANRDPLGSASSASKIV